MSTTSAQGVPTATAHVQGQGKSVKGGHIRAWKAQGQFATTATLALVPGTSNPWREGCDGRKFYDAVLAKGAKTVQQAIDMGAKIGLKPVAVQGHLRWLYTDNGAYLLVDGKRWTPPAAAAAPSVKAPKARAPKAPKAKAAA